MLLKASRGNSQLGGCKIKMPPEIILIKPAVQTDEADGADLQVPLSHHQKSVVVRTLEMRT